MARNRSWYYNLFERAQTYTYTSYPYTYESTDRANVIKGLRTAVRELLAENEKQADEIAALKEENAGLKKLLVKPAKSKGKSAKK